MKALQLTTLTLICLSSAACAEEGTRFAGGPSGGGQYSAMMSAPRGYDRVIQNANNCAPDRAEAVWGAGSALAGYRCVTPSAN
jgi:hypothetical protein